MNRKIISSYTATCPLTGEERTVHIDYMEYPNFDSSGYSYKKDAFSCPSYHECPYPERDYYKRCPLYIKAPDAPN